MAKDKDPDELKEDSEKGVPQDDAKEENDDQKEAIAEHFKSKTDFTRVFSTKALNKDEKAILRDEDLDVKGELGKGGFATVYKAIQISDQVVRAAKVVELKEKRERRIQDCKYELFVLEKINHGSLVKLFNHFMIDSKVYFILEFADGGTLSDHIRKKGPLSEKRAKRWFGQIACAIHHMHVLGIANRDIKLGNILLVKGEKANKTQCKVTDFGLSRLSYRKEKGLILTTGHCGTLPYMSPEILQLKPEIMAVHGSPAYIYYDPFGGDIWALGICLFAMVNKAYPFNPEPFDTMLRNQVNGKFRYSKKHVDKLSEEVKNLIVNMLEPDPIKRITFACIFNHKWVDLSAASTSTEKTTVKVDKPASTKPVSEILAS